MSKLKQILDLQFSAKAAATGLRRQLSGDWEDHANKMADEVGDRPRELARAAENILSEEFSAPAGRTDADRQAKIRRTFKLIVPAERSRRQLEALGVHKHPNFISVASSYSS